MEKQEPRKIRQDLTAEEKARLEKYGSIEFRSAGQLGNGDARRGAHGHPLGRHAHHRRVAEVIPGPRRP
jgi:hypothetical protein